MKSIFSLFKKTMPQKQADAPDVAAKETPFFSTENTQQSFFKPAITPVTSTSIQKKDSDGDSTKATVATVAGNINAGGNILGPIVEKFTKAANDAAKAAKEAAAEAKLAKDAAAIKRLNALEAAKAAGSGKSALKSAAASKAALAANEADKIAKLKGISAAKSAAEATRLKQLLPFVAKVLNKLPLNVIGFVASAVNKYLTTTNTTQAGKIVDTAATAGFDTAFSMTHPFVAAIDAVIGFIPGGDRINISNTMSNSMTSITGSGEAIITGDISGINQFYEDSKAGKNTWLFEKAANAGDFWAEHGGTDRAQMVGDFWGGSDTVAGRATGFLGAIPGIGHAGEGLGWLGFQAYDKGGDALNAAGKGLSALDKKIMPEGRTLNPVTGIKSILDGENPFW